MRLFLSITTAFILVGCATKQIDYTGGKSGVCDLHHVAMVKTVVPVYYGLFPVDQRSVAMYEASLNSFPHAQDSVNPSCVVANPKSAVVYVCPLCQRARREWESAYAQKH